MKSERITIRCTEELLARIERVAKCDRRNLSQTAYLALELGMETLEKKFERELADHQKTDSKQ